MGSCEIGDLTSFIDNGPLILSGPLVPFILTRLKPLAPSPPLSQAQRGLLTSPSHPSLLPQTGQRMLSYLFIKLYDLRF